MSGSATTHNNAKRSRNNDDDTNSGSATVRDFANTPKNAGTIKSVTKTTTPLQAALMSLKLGLESLPEVSRPYLNKPMENIIREYAILYYAKEKIYDMKSTPNYVSSAARKLNFELPVDAEVQESEVYKTLLNNCTARLEAFRVEVTRDFVLVAADLSVESKQRKYYAAICKVYRLLAKTFISQCDIKNYTDEEAILDLLVHERGELLIGLTLDKLLKALKLDSDLPYPTVDHPQNWHSLIDRTNGKVPSPSTPSPSATGTPPPPPPANEEEIPPNNTQLVQYEVTNNNPVAIPDNTSTTPNNDDDNNDDEMYDNNEVEADIIGSREYICRRMYEGYVNCVTRSLEDFHTQVTDNDETRRIKSAMAPTQLNAAASRIATVLGKERPVTQPVLRGMVEETTASKVSSYERRIQALEDIVKNPVKTNNKTKGTTTTTSKKVKGDGNTLKSILRTGTPIAAKTKPNVSVNSKKSSKTKSKSKSKSNNEKNRDANNNDSASSKVKSKGKGRKVSFDGKAAGKRTGSRK